MPVTPIECEELALLIVCISLHKDRFTYIHGVTVSVLLQDTVVIVHSAFCNKSVRILPSLVLMARRYKAAGASLVFASAETFSARYPIKWLHTSRGPKLFFLRSGETTPEQLDGQLTAAAATAFINSKLDSMQHRIDAPRESQETVSDPVPERNDGPVKQVVTNNFDELVLNSKKVSGELSGCRRKHPFPLRPHWLCR